MNIQQLKTLIAVVDEGSFSSAARVLGVSQPAVTMQIRSLEGDLGQSLLDRRYRRIELTEAGRTLLPYAREMIDESERARADLEALNGAVTGPLTLALSTTPGDYIVPRLLGEFLATYPDVHVRITVGNTGEVLEMVEKREADLGMVGAEIKSHSVEFSVCGHDELVLIAPLNDEFASRKQGVTLKETATRRWINRVSDSGTQQVVRTLFSRHKIDPRSFEVAVELGTGEAVVNAVEGGLGIAIVSRYVAAKALELGTVAEVACEDLPYRRPFYLVTPKKTLTRASQAFQEFLSTKL